jgi:hypothetical protein
VTARQTLTLPFRDKEPGREVRLATLVGMRGVDVLLESGRQIEEAPAPDGAPVPPGKEGRAMREALDVLGAYGVQTVRLAAAVTLDDAEREALEDFSGNAREGGG